MLPKVRTGGRRAETLQRQSHWLLLSVSMAVSGREQCQGVVTVKNESEVSGVFLNHFKKQLLFISSTVRV